MVTVSRGDALADMQLVDEVRTAIEDRLGTSLVSPTYDRLEAVVFGAVSGLDYPLFELVTPRTHEEVLR